jgi:large subunit ribosomal protein L10
LAISKERKREVVAQYCEWLGRSQAMVFAEYRGLSMKDMDLLRSKVREAGGEFHIVKNTLGKLALESQGLTVPSGFMEGSTAIFFAFQDVPILAKVVSDFARTSDALKVKGGYLEKTPIQTAQVTTLAELPPLPVVRSQLLGVLMAPASKLVRTLAEPARQVAAVIKSYAEKDTASVTA